MAKSVIPYSRQTITQSDIRAVTKVLTSGWLTTGPLVEQFEQALAKFLGVKYAVAVANGTAALHLACMAAGIGPGDEVIAPDYTFAATANCVLYCGGKPVIADIDEATLCIDLNQVAKKITSKTKAVIAVDFGGRAAPWQKLKQMAKKHDLILIDDAAHSFGGFYDGKRLGSHVDITCFSFHPVKTITTGEGGMVVTSKKKLYQRLQLLRNHGVKRFTIHDSRFKNRPWYYEMRELGYNYRLTDMQSALGLAQLKHIDQFLAKRRRLAARYLKKLIGISYLILPFPSDESAWHLFPLRIDFKKLKKTKEQLFTLMSKHGITLQVHYIPIHLHPYYRKRFGYKRGDFPISEMVYEQEVSLPLYPTLTIRGQDRVIKLVRDFVEG